MRSLLPLLALLAPRSALAADAPATVLRHEVLVTVDAARKATTTVTWEVRIDDPAACAAGLIAPEGLDGAADGSATVLEDTLVIGPDTPAGTVVTLTARHTSDHAGGQSGGFLVAPDLPVQQARLQLKIPAGEQLHAWHDPTAVPDLGPSGVRSLTLTWSNLAPGAAAQAVWSTWPDWMAAGEGVADAVDAQVGDKKALGRELTDGYSGMHAADAFERVVYTVALDPHGPTDWSEARPAAEILAERRGSAVDRGVVLLSLLRLAGHDAEPGYYRPSTARGSFPVTVPAPAMLGRPVVVVHRETGDVYLDPANEAVAIPEVPAQMIGGALWVPGDLPSPLVTTAATDGTVNLQGSLNVTQDGAGAWTLELTATGTAQQALRELLGPLDEAGRTESLGRLVRAGRPDLERFSVAASGLEKTKNHVKITLAGRDAAAFAPLGAGQAGEVPPILAPALAGWLPPNVRVRESVAISVPQTVEVIAASPAPSAQSEWAVITRSVERNGPRVTAITEAHRPYRVSTAGTEAAASAFLDAEAHRGVLVVAHPAADRTSVALLREAGVEPAERYVLEALVWWRQRNAPKATKNLRFSLLEHGGATTAAALATYARGDARLWEFLGRAASDHGTAADRLAVALAAEDAGHPSLAWVTAAELGADDKLEASGRVDGLLLQLRLQPDARPSEVDDPDGFARWKEPEATLAEAEALVGGDDPRILLHRAVAAGRAGDWSGALDRLTRIPEAARSPEADAWHARALAETDAGRAVAGPPLDRALAAAPSDPRVVSTAAAVYARLGEPRQAARYALIAARLDPGDADLWAAVVPAMLAAGDLPTAGLAARRAADLDPKAPGRAETLALVSALLHDADGWARARTLDSGVLPAVKTWPPPLAQLLELAPPEAMLAVLQQHDALVVADPALLAIRAQMRLDAGLLDEAARDGVLLAARHGQADGTALAFAATAGRLYSTTWKKALDAAAEASPAARALRMEVGLLLGTVDPAADAAQLSGDPRAAVLARLKSDPKGLAAEVPGWSLDARDPAIDAPSGCKTNARLGASPGVAACSDAEASTALLRAAPSDALPAPLHQLYTVGSGGEELPGGGRLVRLEGGAVPLWLARTRVGGDAPVDVLALGFSPESARRALQRALE